MKFAGAFSLHHGDAEWQRRDLDDWITDLFEAPSITIAPGCTPHIRTHLKNELTNAGWAYSPRIEEGFDLTVTGIYRDLAFQVQTGNISRAIYDLVKLQYLYEKKRIEAAALALPTKSAAEIIGSNIANADRVWGEVQLFDRVVTLPLLLVSFE
jgi:hypothetical protein